MTGLPSTALFATMFREASARALLPPRWRPGQRTPLWQQRQRSAELLVEAANIPTSRCCWRPRASVLRHVFTCLRPPRRRWLDLRSRKTRLVVVDTEDAPRRSAQSLLFKAGDLGLT